MDLGSHFQQNPFYHFYLWSQEEMPPPPLVLSLAKENMLADMTDLAHRYPVILTHIVTSRLSKILHSLQKQRDPALQNLCNEMVKSTPNTKRWSFGTLVVLH
jgi:hypothetical protein